MQTHARERVAIQDGGANEVGEAFEAGFGGGGGDHGLFFVGEADVHLGGSLHEGGGLGRGLARFEHCGDGYAERLLRSLVALLGRGAVGEDGRQFDRGADVAEGEFWGRRTYFAAELSMLSPDSTKINSISYAGTYATVSI